MHPAEFVRTMISEGKTSEIIALIHRFQDNLARLKTPEHARAYNFSNLFLIAVVGQIRSLVPGQDLHQDPILAIWGELGYFGIDREQIPGNTEGDDETE